MNYYQHAQFLLFPSLYEGFGLPPLEAMACNTPSIVSDIPVLKELYASSAWFTPTNEPKILAEKIKNALSNPSLINEVKANFETTLDKFTWEKSQKIHLDIIEKLING